ncbi:polyhomeotic-like protein 1 [Sarcoptes scabiei]|nr:polyhomeotic-like protein 1 [Sarcoptes scabiei]
MSRKQTEQIDIHSESSSSGLNDINAKNSLALINQLCNQYKIKVEYDLVDVKGPENDRLFEVLIKLGNFERFYGRGRSILGAKRDAAINALRMTRLRSPKAGKNADHSSTSNHSGRFLKKAKQKDSSCIEIGDYSLRFRYDFVAQKLYLNCELLENKSIIEKNSNDTPLMIQLKIEEKEISKGSHVVSTEFDQIQFEMRGESSWKARNNLAKSIVDYLIRNDFRHRMESYRYDSVNSIENSTEINPISSLNDLVTRNRLRMRFKCLTTEGPLNDPKFIFECSLFNKTDENLLLSDQGIGHSKNSARKAAAKAILQRIDKIDQESNRLVNDRILDYRSNSTEKKRSEEFADDQNNSCRILYDIARNMSIRTPKFSFIILRKDQLSAEHSVLNDLMNSNAIQKMFRCEICLNFTESNSESKSSDFILKSYGYGCTYKIAKKIAVSIAAIKIGFDRTKLPFDDSVSKALAKQSFQEQQIELSKTVPKSEKIYKFSEQFRTNYKLVLFILKKFYFYSLKENVDEIKTIKRKLLFLIENFNSNYGFSYDLECIEMILNDLELDHFWNHLELIRRLLAFNHEIDRDTIIRFHFRTHRIEKKSDRLICFITAHLNKALNKENFDLIHRNYCNYSFGSDEFEAKQIACLKILKHLACNAFKYFIAINQRNDADVKSVLNLTEAISSQHRVSHNQHRTKQCMSYLFRIVKDFNQPKPCFDDDHESLENGVVYKSKCSIRFDQNFNNLSARLETEGVGSSKRLSRTLSTFVMLKRIGIGKETYQEWGLEEIPEFLGHCLNQSLLDRNDQKLYDKERMEFDDEKIDEIRYNFDFIRENLLKKIFNNFLKKISKRMNPANLYPLVARETFDYHNHKKQILDLGDQFDQWSEYIRNCLEEKFSIFDREKYWSYLQILSLIGSMLNDDLNKSLTVPIFEFRCHIEPITLNPIEKRKDEREEAEGFLATITFYQSNLIEPNFIDTLIFQSNTKHRHQQNEFLGFGLAYKQDDAREIASFKTLEYLSINLWK